MKAIKITEANKQNFNRPIGSWFVGNLPDKYIFEGKEYHAYKDNTDVHAQHGWFDLINLPIGENQKRTNNIIEVEGGVAYEVVDMTEAEILDRLQSQAESDRETAIQEKSKAIVVEQAQTYDDEQALENSAIYPFWEAGLSVKLNDKYQHFVGTELRLYKVVQAHITQSDWTPDVVPALFTRVQLGDDILDWVQPTGAQDAYNIGDRVRFEGQVYESTVDANVWAPNVFGWVLV